MARRSRIWLTVKLGLDVPRKEFPMKDQVLVALNKVRPALQADGGDLELVEVTEDGVVMVRLHGACGGCPMSTMTLTYGIERFLRQQVPGVTQLVPVE